MAKVVAKTDLMKALEAHKPAVAESYKAMVRSTFARMVEALGPELNGVNNDWRFARTWTNFLCRSVTRETRPGQRLSDLSGARIIDEPALEKNAASYADGCVESWLAKLMEKVAGLESPEVKHLDGTSFLITGTLAGRAVAVEQNMILNVSSTGTPYNQFPARIYVDGKFTSAAAFKKLALATVTAA